MSHTHESIAPELLATITGGDDKGAVVDKAKLYTAYSDCLFSGRFVRRPWGVPSPTERNQIADSARADCPFPSELK